MTTTISVKEMTVEKLKKLMKATHTESMYQTINSLIESTEAVPSSMFGSDQTFDELRMHYRDWEIVEITTLTAIQNFENLLNMPLGIGSDGLCTIALARKK